MFKIINQENIGSEHICCSLSEKKGELTTSLKKAWLLEQFQKGLVFEKLDVRGKVFVEYMPAETAFAPIKAADYYHINCLWVSGKFKGQGYGHQLLERLVDKALESGKKGITVVSSTKKRHFLADPGHLKHFGFKVADTYPPDFELLYYPLIETEKPKFVIQPYTGVHTLYYSHQCPHTEKYAKLIQSLAEDHGVDLKLVLVTSSEMAKKIPCPFTTYALFLDGMFVTTEVLTEKRFLQVLKKHMLI